MPQFQTEYGYFSDDGRKYIITRPDTPMPWVNVISNQNYGLVLSQAGGGYSWLTHAGFNRITRWEQDLIRDEWGKFLYLRGPESGEFWLPARQPAGRKLDKYRVRHGRGYSVIESRYAEIQTRVTYFIPLHDPCEIWQLQIDNRSAAPRRFQVFTYFERLLGAAPDWHREFHRLFIRTWFNPEKIFHDSVNAFAVSDYRHILQPPHIRQQSNRRRLFLQSRRCDSPQPAGSDRLQDTGCR